MSSLIDEQTNLYTQKANSLYSTVTQ